MSDEKCSASAARASLLARAATRRSALARLKSTMTEAATTLAAHHATVTSVSPAQRRETASATIHAVVTKSSPVAIRAATLSALACP